MILARHEQALAEHLGGAAAPEKDDLMWGVVTAVITGPPKKVTVTVQGSTATTDCRYQGWYTPTIGDVVGLLVDGLHLFCIGTRA